MIESAPGYLVLSKKGNSPAKTGLVENVLLPVTKNKIYVCWFELSSTPPAASRLPHPNLMSGAYHAAGITIFII